MSQLIRNLVLFISQICRIPIHYDCRKLNCEGSSTSSRQVRDRFETPAMTLRLFGEEFCRIKFLNMFKIFANRLRLFATQARKLRITATVSRPLWDSLANVSRKLSQTVASQWDRGLIQSNLVISNSIISNYRLSRSENLIPVLTWNYDNRTK